ncbi:MAG TPA: phosphoglucomutase/phosphomannomutase family protein [Crocinitomicaceae bacterium]|nr:phosphoglucomutase/phosphomannomutase family protein [Crocinitomicaceae bacterium]
MVHKIKFGTDGWRAIIAKEYTTENVARIAYATAKWMNQKFENPTVVIGHDCRFGGALFMETAIKVFLHEGLKVSYQNGITSTPMLSLAAKNYNCNLGIILTASHNPPSYNGYKVKAHFGGPLQPEYIQEIEDIIPDTCPIDYEKIDLENARANGTLKELPLEQDYITHLTANFDIEAIKKSGLKFVYDAMYGAGQNVMKKVFPEIDFLHSDYNPSFMGQAPEPIAKNLKELEQFLTTKKVDSALATDGDADRIGLYNGNGEFIDSHHIILLLIHYLAKYKGMSGKVVTAFSCTPRIEKMAKHYGFEHQTTKIGFKDIAKIMVAEDVLLGGEESGGIAVKGHIPERDGIWMGLIIWEFMAKSGKSLDELIHEVYEIVGEFKFERNDLHITEELKSKIIENCKAGNYKSFGKYTVKEVKTTDGFKYFFDDERWMMIRPSGTEPVLRTYAEAPTLEEVREILKITEQTICN